MKSLRLAKDLSLPLDAVTQTFLVVGKRGSGKSNTAARLVEQLHHARLPFVVLDPTDTWWGLKADREGGRGLDVYVFGGRKADLPLEAGGGALIADVLCEHRMSMVLSVKHLSGRARSGFMVAFAQTLFQKWAGGPLHVVLEEAHELAPQMAGGRSQDTDGESAMLGAFKRLWKLGRASGIGGTAVTQRPASLSKDITTQSEILIAHRIIGPQDVKAVGEWVKYHGEQAALLADLPSLPTGEAFIWAPEFPEGAPLGLRRTIVLRRETYDSAATPKVGEQVVEPKELAPVDIERLRTKMAATIEKAKADDPRELRKQLAQVRSELAKAQQVATEKPSKQAVDVQKPLLTDADRALLEKWSTSLAATQKSTSEIVAAAESRVDQKVQTAVAEYLNTIRNVSREQADLLQTMFDRMGIRQVLEKLATVQAPAPPIRATVHVSPSAHPATRGALKGVAHRVAAMGVQAPSSSAGPLPPGELATLTAALQYASGLDKKRLSVLTGYKRSSRDAYIARLRAKGLIEERGQMLYATDAGKATLNGSFQPLPTGADLIDYWMKRLPEGEAKVFDVLMSASGKDVDRDAIDAETGYKRSSRDAYLTRLKARGIVEFSGRGTVRAAAELFEA